MGRVITIYCLKCKKNLSVQIGKGMLGQDFSPNILKVDLEPGKDIEKCPICNSKKIKNSKRGFFCYFD